MDRIVFHIDVNNAFLSWTAVDLLNKGYKYDIRNRYAIIGGDEVSRAKPSPEIYEKAWKKVAIPKEKTLVLEDSLNGIRASYDANIPVIMVPDLIQPTDEAKEKTVAILDDLSAVKMFIAQQNQ